MLGHNFYHQHIRKYVAMFGTLFNDIYIQRDDTEVLKVPITYGPREKFLARLDDPDFRKQAVTLPRMSFEITTMNYDAARKLNKSNKLQYSATSNSTRLQAFNPVPYNINFDLAIMVKNAEDGARIVEQIIPFFTPDFTPSVILDSSMDLRYDVPLILENHSIEDTYEGSFETRRALIHTLSFTMKAYILGPIKEAAIIKFANTNIFTPDTVDGAAANSSLEVVERVDTRPGLTANGTPTSNVADSVAITEINAADDYGFINIITEGDLS